MANLPTATLVDTFAEALKNPIQDLALGVKETPTPAVLLSNEKAKGTPGEKSCFNLFRSE